MEVSVPNTSLVLLVGASGSGKSTFARTHFLETEVISSDRCRALVSDDESNQSVTDDAFDLLRFIARKRLKLGRFTVVDATNVRPEDRKELVSIAKELYVLSVAIVFDLPEEVCRNRNRAREDRDFGPHVIRNQRITLKGSLSKLKYEGFSHVYKFESEEDVATASVKRVPLWNDRRDLAGPFDIIGDIHGCCDELELLLEKLGYVRIRSNEEEPMRGPVYAHPQNRIAIFLGDIVDRGPRIVDTIRLIYNMVKNKSALCVPGNHDMKFLRKLNGKDVQLAHGLAKSVAEVEALPGETKESFVGETARFFDGLISHYVLDGGKLVVAHAGLKEEMQGRGSGKVREFCLFGETTGETDEFGLPVRNDWARDYKGRALVVYGHTPVPYAEWLNRTINIDTGCVFGGKLTALRYPERELVEVRALRTYAEARRPFLEDGENPAGPTMQQVHDDVLDIADILGKKQVQTRLHSIVTIREENAAAALEVMSRFAVNPKWLVYLPPTMSPSETSSRGDFLEYPEEAFAYYRSNGIPIVICERKHMGSRAVVIVCADDCAAERRFGIKGEGIGVIYTRTGRRFFKDLRTERDILERFRAALSAAEFWTSFKTDWACFDCEIMPWSEKALELLKDQYAASGRAGRDSLDVAVALFEALGARNDIETGFSLPPESGASELDRPETLALMKERREAILAYVEAYGRYCWPVRSADDIKVAPFHLLATELHVHADKNHEWHMSEIGKICANGSGTLVNTPYRTVDVTREDDVLLGCGWWEEMTAEGFEGMVVKPLSFYEKGKRGLIQPAIKCRGREYLRLIYGPEYTAPGNLSRLRKRGLGAKRSLALREFALGLEALERFVEKEPLARIHECVFGILALESEPVDPRL